MWADGADIGWGPAGRLCQLVHVGAEQKAEEGRCPPPALPRFPRLPRPHPGKQKQASYAAPGSSRTLASHQPDDGQSLPALGQGPAPPRRGNVEKHLPAGTLVF